MIPKEPYITGDIFGANLRMNFTKEEVTAFLTKLGYIVEEVEGPEYARVDGMYDDEARFATLHVEKTIARKPEDVVPKRMDDDTILYQMGLQNVFLYELKKKLLAL